MISVLNKTRFKYNFHSQMKKTLIVIYGTQNKFNVYLKPLFMPFARCSVFSCCGEACFSPFVTMVGQLF